MKKVVLNADDFCLSKVYNEVILSLMDDGALTSTTVMVERYTEDQQDHIEQLLQKKDVGIGLHVELSDDGDVLREIQEQFSRFVEILGQEPDHLDMHKREGDVYSILMQFCVERGLPYRNNGISLDGGKTTSHEKISAISNWTDDMMRSVDSMNDEESIEVVLHPGAYDKDCKTSLNYERTIDVIKARMLRDYCNDNSVALITFGQL